MTTENPTSGSRLPKQQETALATQQALESEGWVADFSVDADGITCPGLDGPAGAEEFVIEREYRFEGSSNPDDQSILIALTHRPTGMRGALSIAFGPAASADEAAVLRDLAYSAPEGPDQVTDRRLPRRPPFR